jgi:hypothetical protein
MDTGARLYIHHLPTSKEDTTMLSVSTLGPTYLLKEPTHCHRIWYEECIPLGETQSSFYAISNKNSNNVAEENFMIQKEVQYRILKLWELDG